MTSPVVKEYQMMAAVGRPVHMVEQWFTDPVVTTEPESHALSMVDGREVECHGAGAWALGMALKNTAKSLGAWGGALTTHTQSHAVAGKKGFAVAVGGMSTASAGEGGVIALSYMDVDGRLRLKVGYVGENGIVAGETYRLDDNDEFELVL